MNHPSVSCVGLTKSFNGVNAVDNVDLSVDQGHILALLGPSGCGKTTALRLVAGFEIPDSGTVTMDGQIMSANGIFLAPEKRQVGMVFQEYALFPHMTVSQNIEFGLTKHESQTNRLEEMLRVVNLDPVKNHMPHQLSGGQQQRVALARALAPRPKIILLDEPFSNLDPTLRNQIQQETLEILKISNTTALFVTHSQEEAMVMGDRIAIMNQGKIEQVDTPQTIFHYPNNRFIAEFIGASSFLPGQIIAGELRCELATFKAPKGINPKSQTIEIMIRPTQLTLMPSDSGKGKITKKTFQGSFHLYDIVLESGITIKCLQPYTDNYDVGTLVDINILKNQTPCVFVDGNRQQNI